jgi:hypothetical protein
MGEVGSESVAARAPDLTPTIEPHRVAPDALARFSASAGPLHTRALGTAEILALQRTSGNAAVTGLLRSRARLDRDAKHEPLATADDIRQLRAIAVKPLNNCIFDLTTRVDPGTGDVDVATLVEVREKVREVAAAIAVIGNTKPDPAQRDRYWEAVNDLRDALTTIDVRTKPDRQKTQIWVDALTHALTGLDRVMALPVLKPDATPDYRVELVDRPLTKRDHDLLTRSVRPQLAALLKRAKSGGFKPKEEANDDTLASMLAAVDHRGLLNVRDDVHRAQQAMRVFTMPGPKTMREAAVQNLGDAQRKLSAIMAGSATDSEGAAQPKALPVAPHP